MFAKHQVSTGMSALPKSSVDFNINNIHLSLVIVL